MGFKIPKSQYIYEVLIHLFDRIHKTQWEHLLLGLSWWFMLWASRKLAIKYKRRLGWLKPSAPLITCILAVIVGGNSEIFNGCGFERCDRPLEHLSLSLPPPPPTPSHPHHPRPPTRHPTLTSAPHPPLPALTPDLPQP